MKPEQIPIRILGNRVSSDDGGYDTTKAKIVWAGLGEDLQMTIDTGGRICSDIVQSEVDAALNGARVTAQTVQAMDDETGTYTPVVKIRLMHTCDRAKLCRLIADGAIAIKGASYRIRPFTNALPAMQHNIKEQGGKALALQKATIKHRTIVHRAMGTYTIVGSTTHHPA